MILLKQRKDSAIWWTDMKNGNENLFLLYLYKNWKPIVLFNLFVLMFAIVFCLVIFPSSLSSTAPFYVCMLPSSFLLLILLNLKSDTKC